MPRGAKIGNQNAKGGHLGVGRSLGDSSRIRSFGVGLITGGIGSAGHAGINSALQKKVHSGSHALGSATSGLLTGAIGGLPAGPIGVAIGAAVGGVVSGGLGYGLSKGGKFVGSYARKKRG